MNEGAGFGMNASNESIYYKAVQSYYEQNNSKFDEDIILCQKVGIEGSIDLTDMEEVYNFARFIRFNYVKLRDSQNRLQLNTKLKKIFMKSLSDVELEK